MPVLPSIRAAAENPPPSYQEYLQSESWRVTRNHALRRAEYHCERCGARRDLQVHHRTYIRLGHEWDQDLEVLCDDCHGDHHAIEKAKRGDPVRLFIVLAGHALQYDRPAPTTYSDLAESIKERSARLDIPYDSATVGAAIKVVLGIRPLHTAARVDDAPAPAETTVINAADAFRIIGALYDELPHFKSVERAPVPPRGAAVRTWKRATGPMLCGGCGRQLVKGDPIVLIEITYLGGQTQRRRCDQCEVAPPDLPPYTPPDNTITPRPLTRVAPSLPLGTPLADWRARAAGEREPGEDG